MESRWRLITGVGLFVSAISSLMPWLTVWTFTPTHFIPYGFGSFQSLNLIDFFSLVALQSILTDIHLSVVYATVVIALMRLSPILLTIAIVLGITSLVVRRVASFLLPVSGTFCVLAPLLGILAIHLLKQSVLAYGEQTVPASLIQIDYGIYVAVLGSVIVWIGYFNSRLTVSGKATAGAVGLVVLVLFSSLLFSPEAPLRKTELFHFRPTFSEKRSSRPWL